MNHKQSRTIQCFQKFKAKFWGTAEGRMGCFRELSYKSTTLSKESLPSNIWFMSILTFLSGIYIAEEMSGEQNELNSCGKNFGQSNFQYWLFFMSSYQLKWKLFTENSSCNSQKFTLKSETRKKHFSLTLILNWEWIIPHPSRHSCYISLLCLFN